ncbi:MAG TPA: DUF503 domain-containing protein [Thermoanaerobaculia bacterium]|nr:DUF503 domain-containing protein [Thermoanaerobaculia bacterium]
MIVSVALFELHIPHAQSLKDKRAVVRSLRDRLRQRFDLSAAEVSMQDVHQRARLALSFVSLDGAAADAMLSRIQSFVEGEKDAMLTGWTSEKLDFDDTVALGVPGFER